MDKKIPPRSSEDEALFYGKRGFGTAAQWREYHVRLGAFMHAFTRAELRLGIYIADLTEQALRPRPPKGISTRYVISAVFTGIRAAPLRDSLKRLLRNLRKPQEMQEAVGAILAHMGEIQYVRDLLAHRHVHAFNDSFYIDSMQAAREPKAEEVIYFSLDLLDDMTADLLRIPRRLFPILHPESLLHLTPEPDADAPWRYKPRALKHENRMLDRIAQEPSPPPQASRG